MNTMYIAPTKTMFTFKWTHQLINILAMLINEEADATLIPEGGQESALYGLFREAILIFINCEDIIIVFIEILMSLVKKYPDHKETKGTIPQALFDSDWKTLPKDANSKLDQHYDLVSGLISTIIKHNPAVLHLYAKNPENALHLIEKICDNDISFQILSPFISHISSESRNKKGNCGKTALHYLTEAIARHPNEMETFSQHIPELISKLITRENVDYADSDGRTALHYLTKGFYLKCNVADKLSTQCLIVMLMTEKNINMSDKDSVTPYSWLIASKLRSPSHSDKKTISTFEGMFIQMGANTELAEVGLPVCV